MIIEFFFILNRVAKLHDKNLMTSSNLGVCFGPTLLRTAEESVAAIMDIKFVNVIAELLIENYEKVFFIIISSNHPHTYHLILFYSFF